MNSVKKKIIKQLKKEKGAMVIIKPVNVAIPFPPLNFKKIEKVCPNTALDPAIIWTRLIKNSGLLFVSSNGEKKVTTHPLKISIKPTINPGLIPIDLITFVIPGLPLPTFSILIP
tara:strand:+ start:92 stop:436 length:345 start_codon:yes stop_codon:yes gene_type:complete